MKLLKTDCLKTYKDNLSKYVTNLLHTDENEIERLFNELHSYKISIFPSAHSDYNTNSTCRLNIHRKTGKATLTSLKRITLNECNAVYDNEVNLHFYTPTNLYTGLGDMHCVEHILQGEGQCTGAVNAPNTYFMEMEISNLDRIEFFPSWNGYGFYSEYYGSRYSTAVTVDVECDGEKVFSGTISGLVKYDRVKIVFDSFNKVHLDKFNVGTASAFKDYY